MGYAIGFRFESGEEGGLHFGSSTDVCMLAEWVETLPVELYPNLRKLMVEGQYIDTLAGCLEVDPALESHPPDDQIIEELADCLGDLLDRWPDNTLAILDDGANTAGWDELLGLEPRVESADEEEDEV